MDSDDWNACAVPWKVPCTVIGTPICRTAALIASTAWPSAAPCARLNEIVTAGNWLWWLIDSGCTGTVDHFTKVDSGTAWPVLDFT